MKKKQTILIFGAGINQLELIREAKAMGVTTVAVDPQADPPGRAEADFFYTVPGADYDATKEIAVKHNIDGIVTGQMEKPLRLMSRLAQDLGLIFHSPEVTGRSLDKWLMKQSFISRNIPCARGHLIQAGESVSRESTDDLSFPVIIKPKDAFSSRGVLKLASFNDLIEHLDESRSYSSDGEIIVEEFLEGREFSVESVTFRGETTVVQVTEKFITKYPYTVEMGHLQPAGVTGEERKGIEKIVKRAVRALGIDNSASHAEVMLTAEGPKMIEVGARLGGDFISSYLTLASTGVSMDRAAVQTALGIAPDLRKRHIRFSMIRYLGLEPGRCVKEILPVRAVTDMPGVIFAWHYLRPGDVTTEITHSALRHGCVMAAADSRNECIRLTENALQKLKETIILT